MSPRCSSRLKSASRTRSDVGRVEDPGGVWRRRPPAVTLMIRVMSAPLEPYGLLLVETHRDGGGERRVLAQPGVGVDEREGVLAGVGDDLFVLEPAEAQVTHGVAPAALARPEHVALPAQEQVGAGQLEAVGR